MSTPFPRLAIVTGSDSGIGQATAQLLATEGFDVWLTFHSDEEGVRASAEEVVRRGQRCFVERFEASSPDAGDVVDRLAEQLGGQQDAGEAAQHQAGRGEGAGHEPLPVAGDCIGHRQEDQAPVEEVHATPFAKSAGRLGYVLILHSGRAFGREAAAPRTRPRGG